MTFSWKALFSTLERCLFQYQCVNFSRSALTLPEQLRQEPAVSLHLLLWAPLSYPKYNFSTEGRLTAWHVFLQSTDKQADRLSELKHTLTKNRDALFLPPGRCRLGVHCIMHLYYGPRFLFSDFFSSSISCPSRLFRGLVFRLPQEWSLLPVCSGNSCDQIYNHLHTT